MTDIAKALAGTERAIGRRQIPAGEARSVVIRRRYDAPIEDVWQACTDPMRINRWFLPVSGDLRPGGTFQLEGNAGGEILRCEAPHLLTVSWVYGDRPVDEVEVRLSQDESGDTLLELEHATVSDTVLSDEESGLWGVGVGWELPLAIGLTAYLRGEIPDGPPEEWFMSTFDVEALAAECGQAWSSVVADAAKE